MEMGRPSGRDHRGDRGDRGPDDLVHEGAHSHDALPADAQERRRGQERTHQGRIHRRGTKAADRHRRRPGGKNTRGIVNDGTGEVEILIAGGKTYVKADAAFWTKNASAEVATLAAGKYLVVPTGSAAGTAGFEVGTLLDQIFAQDMTTLQSLNTKVAKTEVNGIPAYLMTDRIGSDGSKIYVSADGRARLLRLESPKAQGSLDFTQWDAVPPVSAPPADQLAKIPGM
jgi:hypothetical protein